MEGIPPCLTFQIELKRLNKNKAFFRREENFNHGGNIKQYRSLCIQLKLELITNNPRMQKPTTKIKYKYFIHLKTTY